MAKIAQNWYNSPSIHAKVLGQIKKKIDRGILKLLGRMIFHSLSLSLAK
jgi:hypothetical protein